ncbi:hypothetical protein GCM10027269_59810 [Kribbella endophytica]
MVRVRIAAYLPSPVIGRYAAITGRAGPVVVNVVRAPSPGHHRPLSANHLLPPKDTLFATMRSRKRTDSEDLSAHGDSVSTVVCYSTFTIRLQLATIGTGIK